MERRVCKLTGCKQELSRSGFYRHRNPSVCPGRCTSQITNKSAGLQSQVEANPLTYTSTEVGPGTMMEADDMSSGGDVSDTEMDGTSSGEDVSGTEIDGMSSGEDVSGTEIDGMSSGEDVSGTEIDGMSSGEDVSGTEIDGMSSGEDVSGTEIDVNTGDGSEELNSADSDSKVPDPSTENLPKTTTEACTETGNEAEGSFHQSNAIIKAVCHCLLFFQLKFRIPDRGISFLLAFLKGFLTAILSLVPSSKTISELCKMLPHSLYTLRNITFANSKRASMDYVTCPKCCSLYQLKDCTIKSPGRASISERCSFIEFPNHPQKWRRSKCNALLMKQVKHGIAYKFLPWKTFWFQSISERLKGILERPGMLEMCNKWRDNESSSGKLSDVIDGRLWKDFKMVNNRPFLDVPNNIALALNIDWFNPYEHSKYSIGAIYFTILNLPQAERYKIENTIVAGLMPGPNEPKRINPFLKPIVDDLLHLWKGISVCGKDSYLCVLHCFVLFLIYQQHGKFVVFQDLKQN